jgi:hypothetical protein
VRELLRAIELFQDLDESSLQRIAAAVEEVSLPADTHLFREGTAADALFVIRSGSVRITVQPPGGGVPIVVMRLAAPAVVGERGLLLGARSASALTDAPSVFLKLDRSTAQGLAADDLSIRSWLDALAGGRLHGAPGSVPEGDEGIRILGHRDYVGGGLWEEIGRLQFDFLVAQGLRPSHCLLDIACGALRGGVHFIAYLEAGNYLGLDKERTLVTLGIEKELGVATYAEKKPQLVVSASFEFQRFTKRPDMSIAQSLFTHLNPADIRLCLGNLREFVATGHRLYATFFEGDSSGNRAGSHSLAGFRYSRAELERFGSETGWRAAYLGDWQHPRRQMMMRYAAV